MFSVAMRSSGLIHAPIRTTGERVLTHEGSAGYARDAKSDLFLLAAANMVGERTFYESATSRDERFEQLIHQVVAEDSGWVKRFVPYLRDTMQMRSASIVVAAEYVKAGGEHGRAVVNAAIMRADEPVMCSMTDPHHSLVPFHPNANCASGLGSSYDPGGSIVTRVTRGTGCLYPA